MDESLRLLLVEDSRSDAALIIDELRSGGFNITNKRVDGARDFRRAVVERDWDLVICDHGLPQFNSLAALDLLKRLARPIPLIIVSGVISEDDAVAGMRAGAKDYVTKGNLRRLVPAVQREMREAQVRQMHMQAAADVKVRLIDVIESLDEAFALFDAEDRLVLCNSRYWSMYDISPEIAKPGVSFETLMRALVASGVLPEAEGEEEWIRRRLASHGAPGASFESTLRSGRRLLTSERRTRDGGIVIISTDITALKQAEEDLHQAQKMEAIGQLTGGIAHDFNNLLTAIILNNEVLADLIQDRKLMPLVEATRAAAERGADLNRRLLSFGRRQLLEPAPTDINEVIAGVEQLMRTLGKHIEIRLAGAADLWTAKVDPGQLETVILNLAVNARDAMPGGGQLTIETANVTIRGDDDAAANADLAPGDYIMIAHRDTGTGMTPEVAARAFEPFFTTKEAGRGTGLGLSMVHGFAKQSGGSVAIDSAPGRGSIVRLYLPRTHGPVIRPDDIPSAPAESCDRHHTILLVEDDDLVRGAVERMLGSLGYAVIATRDGAAALEALSHDAAIDMLLTDFALPGGLDGLALTRRARELRPGLRVCLASGYPHEAGDDPQELDVSFIAKPFRAGALGQLLRQILEPGAATLGRRQDSEQSRPESAA